MRGVGHEAVAVLRNWPRVAVAEMQGGCFGCRLKLDSGSPRPGTLAHPDRKGNLVVSSVWVPTGVVRGHLDKARSRFQVGHATTATAGVAPFGAIEVQAKSLVDRFAAVSAPEEPHGGVVLPSVCSNDEVPLATRQPRWLFWDTARLSNVKRFS